MNYKLDKIKNVPCAIVIDESLVTVSGEEADNPGDRMAVSWDLRMASNSGKNHGRVEAVTVLDIMDKIRAPSYIIKTDIQKYDCKVIYFSSDRSYSSTNC